MRPYLCDPVGRKALLRQFIEKIRTHLKNTNHQAKDFSEVCEVLHMIHMQLNKKDLSVFSELQGREVIDYKLYMQGYHKFCNHHWRPSEIRSTSFHQFKGNNTGCLLWGERGCGKSQILTYVTAWAHESDLINFTISNPEQFVGGKTDLFRHKNGLYTQDDLAANMLAAFKHSNE